MDKQMLERMTRIASKGLAFEKLKTQAETVIRTVNDIDFNHEQGWTLAKDYSRDNILNLTSMGGALGGGGSLNRKSTRKLSLFSRGGDTNLNINNTPSKATLF